MWRVQMFDDTEAFTKLVQRWQNPIQQLCTRMLRDSHRGKDLAQETFLRVFTKRKDYQPRGRFATFLWRVALNLCYDELRKIQRRRESSFEPGEESSLPDPFIETADDPSIRAEAGDRAQMVERALARLGEPYRTVIILRHYENLKFREIAEILEIPDGTVKSRMAEALHRLSELLHPVIKEEKLWNHKPARTSECLLI